MSTYGEPKKITPWTVIGLVVAMLALGLFAAALARGGGGGGMTHIGGR